MIHKLDILFQHIVQHFSQKFFLQRVIFYKIALVFLFFFLPKMLSGSPVILHKAERLFSEKLYGDALPFYTLLLSTAEEGNLRAELTLRLAACHLEEGSLEEAFTLLDDADVNERLYLLSLVHKKRRESIQALTLLNQCSVFSTSYPKPSLIALEKGFHLLQLSLFPQAVFFF